MPNLTKKPQILRESKNKLIKKNIIVRLQIGGFIGNLGRREKVYVGMNLTFSLLNEEL